MSALRPQPPGIPAPNPGVHSQAYWDGCRRDQLLYQRCTACGHIGLRASTVCGSCLEPSLRWEQSAGLGTLYSWTVVWRPPVATFHVPYAPAIIRLDEEFWMMSAVVGCDVGDLRDGLRVGVEFHPASDTITLPYFAPLDHRGGRP